MVPAAWYSGSSCTEGWSKTPASVNAGKRKLPNCVELITRSRRRMMKKKNKKEEHEEERRKM